jgi:hypothetical protein
MRHYVNCIKHGSFAIGLPRRFSNQLYFKDSLVSGGKIFTTKGTTLATGVIFEMLGISWQIMPGSTRRVGKRDMHDVHDFSFVSFVVGKRKIPLITVESL